jgi:hypothetical protein
MTNMQKALVLRTLVAGAKDKALEYITIMNEDGFRRDDLARDYHELQNYLRSEGVILSMCYDKECECDDCHAQYDTILALEA